MRASALTLVFALSFGALGCGDDAAEDAAQSAADAMQQAADAMQQAAENLASSGSGDDAEPMSAEELQDALPEEIAGLERTSSERESMGAAGMNMAQATATYEGDGKTLEVRMMSGGGIMAGPAMAFTMVSFDRTTEDGYERTVEHDGMKGMQEYEEDGDYRHAVMTILVNNNLLVRLEAEGMTMDEVEDAFDELDLN